MNKIEKAIDEERNIKPNSLKAYLISIKKLHNAIFNKDIADTTKYPLDFLTNEDKV